MTRASTANQPPADRIKAPRTDVEQRRAATVTCARSALRTGATRQELVEALGALGLLPGQESEWD